MASASVKLACRVSGRSHDWGTDALGRSNHERVLLVKKLLHACGLRCWLDEEQMQGDVNDKMTEGIDNAETVIVFVTGRYITKAAGKGPNGANDNCKLEFDYASLRKGVERMVAVVMEPDVRDTKTWRGVVGAKLGTSLYVDMSGDSLESAVQTLAREIRSRINDCSTKSPRTQKTIETFGSLSGSLASEKSPAQQLAPLPPDVPLLPETTLERPELIASLREHVRPSQ